MGLCLIGKNANTTWRILFHHLMKQSVFAILLWRTSVYCPTGPIDKFSIQPQVIFQYLEGDIMSLNLANADWVPSGPDRTSGPVPQVSGDTNVAAGNTANDTSAAVANTPDGFLMTFPFATRQGIQRFFDHFDAWRKGPDADRQWKIDDDDGKRVPMYSLIKWPRKTRTTPISPWDQPGGPVGVPRPHRIVCRRMGSMLQGARQQ